MDSIGSQLRAARAAKKSSLEDAAKATKIRIDHLAAFEGDDFSKSGAAIYTRSFLKTYCEYLGLNAPAILLQLIDQHGAEQPLAPVVKPAEGSVATAAGAKPIQISPKSAALVVGVIVIALGIIIGAVMWSKRNKQETHSIKNGSTQPTPPTNPSHAVVAKRREMYVSAPIFNEIIELPASASSPLAHKLTIKITQTCYTQIVADGEKLVDGLLDAGWQKEFTAKQFNLIFGNAAGASLTFDGKIQPKLGNEGERVTLGLPTHPSPR